MPAACTGELFSTVQSQPAVEGAEKERSAKQRWHGRSQAKLPASMKSSVTHAPRYSASTPSSSTSLLTQSTMPW